MKATGTIERLSINDRLAALRESKQQQTLEKQQIRGAMDFDDHGIILPPRKSAKPSRLSVGQEFISPTSS